MSRLHRKCLIASTAVHGLLLLVLLVGAAFLDRRPEPPLDLTLLDVIPDKVVDALISGGGNPAAQPAPPPQPPVQQIVPRPVKTPKPEPLRPEPEPKPQPKPDNPPKEPDVKVANPTPAPPKPKPQITVNTKPSRVNPPKRQNDQPAIRPGVTDSLQSLFEGATSRLNRELTPHTTIGVPGPGGEAFASYKDLVISIYEREWMKPMGIEQPATVKATVTIARDGRVLSARITQLSRNRTVDDSVDQVLRRVKEIRPFPEGAKDDTRTFDLSFELTPAELSG